MAEDTVVGVTGTEVTIAGSDVTLGDRGLVQRRGVVVAVQKIDPVDVPDFVAEKARERATPRGDGDLAAANGADQGKAKKEIEEMRTLPVEYDSYAERFRLWRDVASAIVTDDFGDFPSEGPRTA